MSEFYVPELYLNRVLKKGKEKSDSYKNLVKTTSEKELQSRLSESRSVSPMARLGLRGTWNDRSSVQGYFWEQWKCSMIGCSDVCTAHNSVKLCENAQNHCIVYFTWINCILWVKSQKNCLKSNTYKIYICIFCDFLFTYVLHLFVHQLAIAIIILHNKALQPKLKSQHLSILLTNLIGLVVASSR